jgi:sodium transport system permease protein
MRFRHIILLLKREIRDQLRDRRMLFMMFVLPLLLYPVMGIMFFQTSQFTRQTPSRVLVLMSDVAQELPNDLPPLFAKNDGGTLSEHFDASLFESDSAQRLVQLQFETHELQSQDAVEQLARQKLDDKTCDVVLVIPEQRSEFGIQSNSHVARCTLHSALPKPEVFYTSSNQKSPIANTRLKAALQRWDALLGEFYLRRSGVDPGIASPLKVTTTDVSATTEFRGASFWSKFLPVLLLLWALTGAFYPSVDLCAGEKERGTLETLLSSPAGRGEIVISKLLTIMTFSVLTSILNILCVGATAYLMVSQLAGVGLPPRLSLLWLLLALIPTAAMFSALCIALASYAKSSKEGQYYLSPLILVVLPLVMIPMAPGQELSLGMALIPVTGIVLTLSALIEGQYAAALTHLPIVLLVTLGCCVVAMRWAIDQFNSEGVLFRESEKFHLKKWLKRLLTTRVTRPTPQAALLCAFVILALKYFISLLLQGGNLQVDFVANVLVTQFAVILLPVAVLVAVSSSSVRETLRLGLPRWWAIPFAFLLALCWHPISAAVSQLVLYAYPYSDELKATVTQLEIMFSGFSPGMLVLLIAVVPGICEEIAFRGYILTGLDTKGHRLRAIILTSVFFGITHGILQQSLVACVTGLVLAWLAIQTRSIWPCVVFHITNNSIAVLLIFLVKHCADSIWFKKLFGDMQSLEGMSSSSMIGSTPGLLYSPGGVTLAIILFAGLATLLVALTRARRISECQDRTATLCPSQSKLQPCNPCPVSGRKQAKCPSRLCRKAEPSKPPRNRSTCRRRAALRRQCNEVRPATHQRQRGILTCRE